jgi:hypothetical protein
VGRIPTSSLRMEVRPKQFRLRHLRPARSRRIIV